MKKWILLLVIMLLAASAAGCTVTGRGSGTGSSTDGNSNEKGADEMRERYETTDGETGYIYLPSSSEESGNKTYPLVIMMNGTAQDPIHDAEGTGWVDLAQEKDIILLVPEYDDYATYSNVDTLISVLDYIEDKYPVDETRVYSTGFSNGGAMSVALAAEHPERFAAISAYGWMVDMMYEDPMADQYDMPFQVLQGTREYTGKNSEGSPVIMLDEREAVRSLFLFNEMITDDVKPDYRKTPYWGYEPSSIEKRNAGGTALTISSYKKDGYKNPFAQLVLIDGETHRVHPYDAGLAWDFMKKFQRNKDGSISER